MLMKFISSRFDKFFDALVDLTKNIAAFVLFLLGICLIIVSVGIALYMPIKALAVVIASVGSCSGTFIMAMWFPKKAGRRIREEKEEHSRVLKKHVEYEKQIEELIRENENIQIEIERHKRMRVDVNAYSSILRLGLSELDIDSYDFVEKQIEYPDKTEKERPRREYIGVIRHRLKARFGIDLMKVKISDSDGDMLEISGLETEFQGILPNPKDGKTIQPWVLAEIREYAPGSWINKTPSYKITSGNRLKAQDIPSSDEYVEYATKQNDEYIARLSTLQENHALSQVIITVAQQFLRFILAPMGKEIVFVENSDHKGLGLVDYLRLANRDADDKIKALEQQKKMLSFRGIGNIESDASWQRLSQEDKENMQEDLP